MNMLPNDSPWWPWLRMATRQAMLLGAFGIYYSCGLELPDFKTMASLLSLDVGMEMLKEKFNKP